MANMMDPTQVLITQRPAFQSDPEIVDVYQTVAKGYAYRPEGKKEGDVSNMVYSSTKLEPVAQLTTIPTVPDDQYALPAIQNVNQNLYKAVELYIKPLYGKIPDIRKVYQDANPFENIGMSHFMDRAAVKIAACDAIFKFTGHVDGVYVPQVQNDMFRYSCVAEGPGAFVQYIQYRLPQARGYGITLNEGKRHSLNWNTQAIDMAKFKPVYGDSGTGDIIREWKNYSKFVLNETGGVDLCTGDGGLDASKNYPLQEFLSAKLIYYEVLIALLTVKYPTTDYDGGTFFLKLFNSCHKITQDLIYIITCCFENVWIHKPISSRPANSERYLIATKKRTREECEPWIDFLIKAQTVYLQGQEIMSLLPDFPPEFNAWMTYINDLSMNGMYQYGLYMLKYAGFTTELNKLTQGRPLPDLPKYDLNKALILWNLPSNSLVEVSSCARTRGTSTRGRGRGRGRGRSAGAS